MATIYYTSATLDGFMAGPGDSLDWLDGHDRHEDRPSSYGPFIARVGTVVMGRRTFDWVAAHDPEAAVRGIYAEPTWILTHRPIDALPDHVHTYAGDISDLHEELAAASAGRDVWIVGGGEVAGAFADAGLLDEIWVQLAPVTLGAGTSVLPRRLDLELIDAEANGAFVDVRYRVRR